MLDKDDGAKRDLGQDVQHGVEQHLQERQAGSSAAWAEPCSAALATGLEKQMAKTFVFPPVEI